MNRTDYLKDNENSSKLRVVFNLLRSNKDTILLSTFFAVIVALTISFSKPVVKLYRASAVISPASVDNEIVIDTAETIKLIKDQFFLKKAIASLCPGIAQIPLYEDIIADSADEGLIKIAVKSHDPTSAVCIAYALAICIVEHSNALLYASVKKIHEKIIEEGAVIKPPELPQRPMWVRPQRLFNIATATLIGFLTGIMLILLFKDKRQNLTHEK